MSIQRIEIDFNRITQEIGQMSEAEIDGLPFGAIQLDKEGMVLTYNQFEAKFAGRAKERVVGRHFFDEIAPCTRVKEFYGAFQEGVRRKELNEVFDFVFEFPQGPKHVRIRMIYGNVTREGIWIFVTPMDQIEP